VPPWSSTRKRPLPQSVTANSSSLPPRLIRGAGQTCEPLGAVTLIEMSGSSASPVNASRSALGGTLMVLISSFIIFTSYGGSEPEARSAPRQAHEHYGLRRVRDRKADADHFLPAPAAASSSATAKLTSADSGVPPAAA
jgi:hypothetical protein